MILTIFVITISLGYYLNKIRFGQFVDQIENVNTSKGGSFIERYQYANCSFELIQESPIFGFGVGDVDEKIKQKLIKYNYKFLLDRGVYDPHNEFLKAYIGMGIIGFFCFMGIFVSIFYQLSKRKNILLFFYMGFVFVVCLIEPFLSRQAGILPALFFIGLLVDGHKNKFENGRYV